jgi:hypothetical protein
MNEMPINFMGEKEIREIRGQARSLFPKNE